MLFILEMPKFSDYMTEGIIETLDASIGSGIRRGAVLAKVRVEIEIEDDTLACPPGYTFEIVAGEDGYLRSWEVSPGETVPVERIIAMLSSDAEELINERDLRDAAKLRYSCRQVLT